MLVMSYPENIHQLLQMIGTVHRFGQEEEQKIWVGTLNESYDNWLQANAAAKFSHSLVGKPT
jgi:hypothetical protein